MKMTDKEKETLKYYNLLIWNVYHNNMLPTLALTIIWVNYTCVLSK